MKDTFKTKQQWKQGVINRTAAPLAEQVSQWDAEIMAAHICMAKRMVQGGSFQALTEWMKGDDEDAVFFRQWVEDSGHRQIISHLYTGLKSRDIEELKTILHEG